MHEEPVETVLRRIAGAARHLPRRNSQQKSSILLANGSKRRVIVGPVGIGWQELETGRNVVATVKAERAIQPQIRAIAQAMIAVQRGERSCEVMNHASDGSIAGLEVSKARVGSGARSRTRFGQWFRIQVDVGERRRRRIQQLE